MAWPGPALLTRKDEQRGGGDKELLPQPCSMLLLLLFWTRLAAAQQDRHSSSTGTGPVLSGERVGPCFEEDAVAALREALQPDGALSNSSLALFGACTAPERSSGSAFSLLSEELRRPGGGLDVLRPAAGEAPSAA